MSRFKAIGNFVYEKGDRIGVTLDEAAIELAQKLNAYQMRVERFKEQDRSQNEAHRINTSMWKDDLVRYKEMCDELDAECTRLKAEVARLKDKIDHLTPPLWLRVVAWLVSFVGAFFLAELVVKWLNR